MSKFWELLEQSIITQALVTAILVFTVCFMWATGKPIPQDLMQLTTIVLGFWFGSKIGFNAGVRKIVSNLGASGTNGKRSK